MIDPALVKKIKQIQLKANHLATDSLAGEYLSAFKGKGMEFEKLREYLPGDDIRSIDWNVMARMNAPFIKVFQEEREMTMMLLVDVSPSQNFGSRGPTKQEIACEFAALMALLAVKNNDKVGLILFSDHVETSIRPAKGRGHIWNIIRQVLSHQPQGQATRIDTALEHLWQVRKRRCLCFLLTDFYAQTPFEKALSQTAARHDLVCVRVHDPLESQLGRAGLVEIEDSESGERLVLDTHHPQVAAGLQQLAQEHEQRLQDLCRRSGTDMFSLGTQSEVVTAINDFLRRRELRRYR